MAQLAHLAASLVICHDYKHATGQADQNRDNSLNRRLRHLQAVEKRGKGTSRPSRHDRSPEQTCDLAISFRLTWGLML